jgi:hypothetical protein
MPADHHWQGPFPTTDQSPTVFENLRGGRDYVLDPGTTQEEAKKIRKGLG